MPDNKKGKGALFGWIMGIMGSRLPLYLGGILLSTFGMASETILIASITECVVDAACRRESEGLLAEILWRFGLFVLSWLLWRLGIMRYNIEGRRGCAKLEKMVFAKALRMPMEYYEEHHSGDFLSKLTYDVEKAGDIYKSRLRRLASAVLSSVFYLIPMCCYNMALTGCLLGVSLVSFAVNQLFLEPMKNAGKRLSDQNRAMTEKLTNLLSGMETAKLFPMGHLIQKDYRQANEAYYDIQKKTNHLKAALESVHTFFDLLGALAFLGIGVWFVANDYVTVGALTGIYTLYGSFRYVFLDIGRYLPQMMNCLANAQQLYDFLQLPEEPEHTWQKGDEPMPGCALQVEELDFAYREERKLFDRFSLTVQDGECVALVGESGCGKSTLAKLLLGFLTPAEGRLYLRGKDAGNIPLRQLRNYFAYVPQEPYLFNVSIAENIAYGKSETVPEEVSMAEIERAARIANAHEFIQRLPQGYDTVVGERGNKLSGGERQRIAIARAVLRDAPILLLDEATSALDNESERLVNEALRNLSENRTTIMIAHRESTIRMADKIITVK